MRLILSMHLLLLIGGGDSIAGAAERVDRYLANGIAASQRFSVLASIGLAPDWEVHRLGYELVQSDVVLPVEPLHARFQLVDSRLSWPVEVTGSPPGHLLIRNAPNPFSATTTLALDLPRAGHVTIRILDIAGREVARVADRDFGAGRHDIPFTGRSAAGHDLPGGIYFVHANAGGASSLQRISIVR